MCGRFAFAMDSEEFADYFGLEQIVELEPHFNIAPSQFVWTLTWQDGLLASKMRWGFVPPWQKEADISSRFINARVETAHEKPMFRHSFQHKRCLIVASGFYEWYAEDREKTPYFIFDKHEPVITMAGIWSHWEQGAKTITSCSILTQDANAKMAKIHHRMPVIIDQKHRQAWCDPKIEAKNQIFALLQDNQVPTLNYHPVSKKVNNPRYDRSDCITKRD